MQTRHIIVATALAGLVGAFVYGGDVSATPPTPGGVTTTILATSTLDDLHIFAKAETPAMTPARGATALRHGLDQGHDQGHDHGHGHDHGWRLWLMTQGLTDAYVVDNKFAPGADTGWHSHPGPSIVFVVAGTMTNYSSDSPGCAPQVYPAGSNFVDPGGNDSHLLRNEGTVPAETIAFQMIPNGTTRRIDEPVPPGCS
jgi:quercetin dioxygenase-like cupin family protein